MYMILNVETLEEVDCFKYLGSQVAADGGCERHVVHKINNEYRALEVLKSVLSNRGLRTNPRRVYMSNCTNGVVWSRGMGYEEC